MNDTSYTALMHALNAQMAANQAAIHLMESHAETFAGEENRAINDASMGSINNIGLNANSKTPGTRISPGETRNGKKRVSPSIPLCSSQLIGGAMGNGGGTGTSIAGNITVGMKSVAEEGEESVLGSSSKNVPMMNLLQQQQFLFE